MGSIIELTGQARFIKSSEGIITDNKTGLQWFVGPQDIHMNWDEAISWIKSLSVSGGGWRMPLIKELRTLYQKGKEKNNLDPIFNLGFYIVWSGNDCYMPGESTGSASSESSCILNFDFGTNFSLPCGNVHTTNRSSTFAVRSQR